MKFLSMCICFILLTGCTTIRANWHLYRVTTKEDKAELLFLEGERLYNEEFIEEKRLDILPKVVRYMSDAYALDPTLDSANQYIEDINQYKLDLYTVHMESIREYASIEEPTDVDRYKLVIAIKQSNELDLGDKELKEYTKLYKGLIPEVVLLMEVELKDLELKILELSSYKKLIDPSILYKRKSRELFDLDRSNVIAIESLEIVDSYIDEIIYKGITESETLMESREYVAAELIVREAAILYKSYFKVDSKEILDVKYRLFMEWGEYLMGRGQLQIARNITKLAYDISRSEESNSQIRAIDREIKSKSFESTIDDILVSIDYYIEKEDPVSAIQLVNTNLKKFKSSDSKIKLNKKKDIIDGEIERLYSEAIVMYRDEDYEGALKNLSIVYDYNSNYKQVKDYYNRTETKVKALSGVY